MCSIETYCYLNQHWTSCLHTSSFEGSRKVVPVHFNDTATHTLFTKYHTIISYHCIIMISYKASTVILLHYILLRGTNVCYDNNYIVDLMILYILQYNRVVNLHWNWLANIFALLLYSNLPCFAFCYPVLPNNLLDLFLAYIC